MTVSTPIRQFGFAISQPCRRSISVLVIAFLCSSAISFAADTVSTEISQEKVWTGQAVSISVTLYAPGPFSGAASFDIPEVPLTVIASTGSPVVGSEDVDGETFYTQLHTFHVYTQQTGKVTIPSFPVRFEWKDFTSSEATPINGKTTEQTFECSRPPGTEGMGVVVAAEQFRVEQSWIPDDVETFQPGDLIQRRIEINAVGTTAMMLPQSAFVEQEGIRIYSADPEVLDKTQRGETSAQRADTLKYQFEAPGTFQLPDLVFAWWDVGEGELRTETISGRIVTVSGVSAVESTDSEEAVPTQRSNRGLIMFLGIAVAGWILRGRIRSGLNHLRSRGQTPEASVIKACRSNDPHAACSALLEWQRIRRIPAGDTGCSALDYETQKLAKQLFASPLESGRWNGEPLRVAFLQGQSELVSRRNRSSISELPALNPTGHL